jgi:hypothetical protein
MRLRNDSNVVSSVWIVTSREVVLVKEVEQQPAALEPVVREPVAAITRHPVQERPKTQLGMHP